MEVQRGSDFLSGATLWRIRQPAGYWQKRGGGEGGGGGRRDSSVVRAPDS